MIPCMLTTDATSPPAESSKLNETSAPASSHSDGEDDENEDDEDADDDDDEFGGGSSSKRSKSNGARRKSKPKLKASAGRFRPSEADIEASRISSRNGKKLPNYNEDSFGLDLSDGDDPFEDAVDKHRGGESLEGEFTIFART